MTPAWIVAALGIALASFAGLVAWRARVRAANLSAAEEKARTALKEAESALEKARADIGEIADARDVEARRRETAEAARDNLYSLINGLPRPIWWRNSDLSLLYANDAYLAAVGLDRDQVLASNAELVDADDREAAHALARSA